MLLFDLPHPTLRLGVVSAARVRFQPSSVTLLAELARAEARVRADPALFPESVRTAVRDVLRVGGYKPTGRGKPASELLLSMAQKEALPHIGNLVEINNLVSLESGLPISIFDAERLGPAPRLRFGRAGESYVFNQAGHAMDLEGLPVVCRSADDTPVGNAVRDSMLGKVSAETTRVVAVVYASRVLAESTLLAAVDRLLALLRAHADADGLTSALLP
jgi:DNA/RNA-binding domain of Phe-tRNA-synthetase-like protein